VYTPNIPAASGASSARMALFNIVPVSPLARKTTSTLFSCSKAVTISSLIANESWVMTVRVAGPAGAQEARMKDKRRKMVISGKWKVFFMGIPFKSITSDVSDEQQTAFDGNG